MIQSYRESLLKYVGIDIDMDTLISYSIASELLVALRYWAEYLQTSDSGRVLRNYQGMIDKYIQWKRVSGKIV